jgi:SAM-dependent methyltransferase
MSLPFADESFDVVAAFDVIEHCDPEADVVAELSRVLVPGGRLLLSVPAYQWAWTKFDDENGHYRRYTRPRAKGAVRNAGMRVERATYAFASVFPFFVVERLVRRLREGRRRDRGMAQPSDVVSLPSVPPVVERLLLLLSQADRAMLRRTDLPFGSSVVIAATKPPAPARL